MSYESARPIQTLAYDVVNKKWIPMPRFRVGSDGILDVEISEGVPTDGNKANPSLTLTYVAGDLTRIDKLINGVTYTKTFTWTAGDLTDISSWS